MEDQDMAGIVDKAVQMAGDPNFMAGVQFAREQAPDFVTGIAWSLLPLIGGLQKSAGLDDDAALDQVLPAVIQEVLEIAAEGGDDEATPDQVEAIRAKVIDMLGQADAEAELAEERRGVEDQVAGKGAAMPVQGGAMTQMLGGGNGRPV